MPRQKKVKVEEPIEVKEPVINDRGDVKDEKKEPKVEEKKEVAPVATGKFYALKVEGGAVIVNPNGVRVSKVMPVDRAERDAQRMNK